jgi:hypothetical protein
MIKQTLLIYRRVINFSAVISDPHRWKKARSWFACVSTKFTLGECRSSSPSLQRFWTTCPRRRLKLSCGRALARTNAGSMVSFTSFAKFFLLSLTAPTVKFCGHKFRSSPNLNLSSLYAVILPSPPIPDNNNASRI